jgi:hypothetical protein
MPSVNYVVLLNVLMLSAIILSVVLPKVLTLNGITLSVVMLKVVALKRRVFLIESIDFVLQMKLRDLT